MYKVLVGLGNPGAEYKNTRHNVGFEIIDHIAAKFNFPKFSSKYNAQISVGEINGLKIALVKPMSYMNNSGIPLSHFLQFFKIATNKVVVLHDELDLETARCKMKLGGSNAGHNGLKSVDQYLGKSYYRVRIGISRPHLPGRSVSNYVLSKFSQEELEKIEKLKQLIDNEIDDILMHQTLNFTSKAGEFFKANIEKAELLEGGC